MNFIYFGGSFNPISKLHIETVKCAKEYFNQKKIPIKVLLSICPDSYPYKKLLKNEHRYEMCKIASKDYEWIEIIRDELDRPWERTRVVLEKLRKKYDGKIYFLCGTDKIYEFEKYWKYEDVIEFTSKHPLIIIQRPGYEISDDLMKKYKLNDVIILKFNNSVDFANTSSTKIRENLKNNKSIAHMTNPLVEKYIKDNKITFI